MKYLLWFIICLFIFGGLAAFAVPPVWAATAQELFNQGLRDTAVGTGHSEFTVSVNTFPGTIGKIIALILSFLGVIFLILMIYGGFTWMTARGNEQQITKAKGIIFNALVGLIVVMAAYAITAYFGDEIATVVTG